VRARGLFCRSVMTSQMASPTYTPVFAALVAVVNTKFPEIGELLLHRLVLQARALFRVRVRVWRPAFLPRWRPVAAPAVLWRGRAGCRRGKGLSRDARRGTERGAAAARSSSARSSAMTSRSAWRSSSSSRT